MTSLVAFLNIFLWKEVAKCWIRTQVALKIIECRVSDLDTL
jgi:hypothetical protein